MSVQHPRYVAKVSRNHGAVPPSRLTIDLACFLHHWFEIFEAVTCVLWPASIRSILLHLATDAMPCGLGAEDHASKFSSI